MIITRTPFRVSFFGGGTDIKSYYKNSNGLVLSTAINKYLYVVVKKKLGIVEHKYRINWSKVEFTNKISSIKNPIARECLRYFKINYPIEITTFADIPANTGLGSSSAFAVGLVNGLFALTGQQVTKYQIASTAAKIEIDIIGRKIGKQDHFACCYGGLNLFEFFKDERVNINPVLVKKNIIDSLERNMILFFTNLKRDSESTLKKQFNLEIGQKDILDKMKQMTYESNNLINSKNFNLKKFGCNLDLAWQEKKKLTFNISNNIIDKYYKIGKKMGAYGGKLLGAGNGGFLLFVASKNTKKKLIKKFYKLKSLHFLIDNSGSRITYFDRTDL